MKDVEQRIYKSILEALNRLGYSCKEGDFNLTFTNDVYLGDICTNAALVIGSKYKEDSVKIGKKIVELFEREEKEEAVKDIRVEDNGFINIRFTDGVYKEYYGRIREKRSRIGEGENTGRGKYIELVSANPTGLLHIGHLRNGIFTDTLSNLYEYLGYTVRREFLVNDAGSQIEKLVRSFGRKWNIWSGVNDDFSHEELEYDGESLDVCLEHFWNKYKLVWFFEGEIEKSPLYRSIRKEILEFYLGRIKEDLEKYGIGVLSWKRESTFANERNINELIREYRKYLDVKGGAVWLEYGGEKNVLIKKDGNHTYFMQDLIYHKQKLNLIGENDEVIDVIGSDHDGHVERLKGAWRMLGGEDKQLDVLVMQMVKLQEEGKSVEMSKRRGNAIFIRDVEKYMGYEEVRWYLNSQSINKTLEIDVQELKNKENGNKVFYVMYAYSRTCGILERVVKDYRNMEIDVRGMSMKERELFNMAMKYETVLESIAKSKEMHQINNYLFGLAKLFNSYYEETNVLESKDGELEFRLGLVYAVRCVLKSGLRLLKIKAKNRI